MQAGPFLLYHYAETIPDVGGSWLYELEAWAEYAGTERKFTLDGVTHSYLRSDLGSNAALAGQWDALGGTGPYYYQWLHELGISDGQEQYVYVSAYICVTAGNINVTAGSLFLTSSEFTPESSVRLDVNNASGFPFIALYEGGASHLYGGATGLLLSDYSFSAGSVQVSLAKTPSYPYLGIIDTGISVTGTRPSRNDRETWTWLGPGPEPVVHPGAPTLPPLPKPVLKKAPSAGLCAVLHRGRIIHMRFDGSQWYVSVGAPTAPASGNPTWSFGAEVSLGLTNPSDKAELRENAGVLEFTWLDTSGAVRISRCYALSNDGTGTWLTGDALTGTYDAHTSCLHQGRVVFLGLHGGQWYARVGVPTAPASGNPTWSFGAEVSLGLASPSTPGRIRSNAGVLEFTWRNTTGSCYVSRCYALSNDGTGAWLTSAAITGTYDAHATCLHKGRIVFLGYRSGQWYVRVGTPDAPASGNPTWSFGAEVSLGLTNPSDKAELRENAGVLEFTWLDTSGAVHISRCYALSNDGTGTWA